jgi:hypothetical protein
LPHRGHARNRSARSNHADEIPLLRRLDPFILGILITVGIASLIPAQDTVLAGFGWATKVAVGVLFFLYGARLSSPEALHGLRLGVSTTPSSWRHS